jgi:transposase
MAHLKGYQGYLQADAYQGYDVLYDEQQPHYRIIEVACWAHVRRKFYEVAQQAKTTGSAHQALSFTQKLYHVEREARALDDEARKQLRQEKAKPILEEFKSWLDALKDRLLPKSPVGEAVNYTLKNWLALNRYLEDGMLDIDNNAAERLIKPIKIGVKNYLFNGSDLGAENAAIFYSLIETCKLHHINPYEYLRDILIRLPTQLNSKIDELLPWHWKPVGSNTNL